MVWAKLKCKLWTGQFTSQMFLSVVFQIVPLPKSNWGIVLVWQCGQEFWCNPLLEVSLLHSLSIKIQTLQYLSLLLITSIAQARINSLLVGSRCLYYFLWLWQKRLAAYPTTSPISILPNSCLYFSGKSKKKSPVSVSHRIILGIKSDIYWVVLLAGLCFSNVEPQLTVWGKL